MGHADHYDHGNWNFICDVCGFKFKASDGQRRWDGVYVCRKDFELRHPQEKRRGMKDTQSVEWTRPDSEPGFIACVGKAPIEYQSHTQTTPKANANYGSGISLSRNAAFSVTSAPAFNFDTDFYIGETNLQVRNSSYQGPPIVLPITETLLPSSLYGSFIFISEDGSTVVSNAHGYDASNGGGLGALFIHKDVGGVWTQVATILSLDVDTDNGLFGFQMSISGDGNRILVTAPTMGAVNRGKAFMLDTSNGWTTFTFAPVLALNLPDQSRFGHNCWLSSNGQTAFVGALEPDASGAVYVFEQREGAWSQLQKITASNSAANAYFGAATVDLSALDRLAGNGIASSGTGSQLIIGAPGAAVNAASDQGIVYHFTRTGDSWVEAQIIPLPIADAVNDTIFFGYSVGMSGNGSRIVVGVPRSFVIGGPSFTGKIAFYQLCVDGFELIESKAATSPQGFEFSGSCVAISPDGQFAASGAIEYDAEESGQGRVLYYDFDFPFSAPPVVPKLPPIKTITYSDLVIAAGPDAYYQQDQTTGNVLTDSIGSQNASLIGLGGVLGSDPLKTGDAKTSVKYPRGSGSEIVLLPSSNLHNSGDIAIETIIKLDSLDTDTLRPIASKGLNVNDPDMDWIFLVVFNNRLRFQSSVFPSFTLDTPASSLSYDIPYHVVVNLSSAGAVMLYINGIELASSGGFPRVTTIGDIYLSHEPFAADYLMGWQSDTAFYGRLLTDAEILQRASKALNP